jgi:nitronate monooxygenase
MGTRILAAQESLAPAAYKQMVIDHGPDDLVVTAAVTGTDASWLRPSLVAHGLDPDAMAKPVNRDYNSSGDGGRRWIDLWAAGQGLGTIHAIEPVAAIVDDIELGFRAALERLHTTHGR